jgi:hypothetical protein
MRTRNQITSRQQKRHVVYPDQDTPKPQSPFESVTQAKESSSVPSTTTTTDRNDINVGLSNPKTSSIPKEKFSFSKFEEMTCRRQREKREREKEKEREKERERERREREERERGISEVSERSE